MSQQQRNYTKHLDNLRIILPALLRRRKCLFRVEKGNGILYRIDSFATIYAFEDNTLVCVLPRNVWLKPLCYRIK